jgi:hypothetical protein
VPKTWESISDAELTRAYHECGGNVAAVADKLKMSYRNLQRRCAGLGLRGQGAPAVRRIRDEVVIPEAPDPREPIEDLLKRKKAQFDRSLAYEEWAELIPVQVKLDGPVALCAIGDPHVDDDGCDIGAIERDMTVIGQTEGMFAVHVGDFTNNWIGRLVAKYAHQRTTFDDGIRLCEWMFELAPPLVVVGGNHDKWNEGMSWLNFVLKRAGSPIAAPDGVRMAFKFPQGEDLRMHVRHDFPGNSQYNPLHGLRREHLFGKRDHINIAGHRHTSAAAALPSPDGYTQWMFRVEGYKRIDEYASAMHFQPSRMAPAVGLLIDPTARVEAERVKPFWDLEECADVLSFKRNRK